MKHTYSEFLNLLNQFQDGNDSILSELESSQIEWAPLISDRLMNRLIDCINIRLNLSQDNFCKYLMSNDRTSINFELLQLKKRIHLIQRLTNLNCIPSEGKKKLQESFKKICIDIEKSIRTGSNDLEFNLISFTSQTTIELPNISEHENQCLTIIRRKSNG